MNKYEIDKNGYVWLDDKRPAIARIQPQAFRGRDEKYQRFIKWLMAAMENKKDFTELEKMADEALADYREGRTEPLIPDEL